MTRFSFAVLVAVLALALAVAGQQSPTASPSPSASPSTSVSPSTSALPSGSGSPSASPSPSSSPSVSASPSGTPSNTPSPSATPSNTPSPSVTPSNTPSPSPSASSSPLPSVQPVADVAATFGTDPEVTLSGTSGRDEVSVSSSFAGVAVEGGGSLNVANTTRETTTGTVTKVTYNTTFDGSSAVLQQIYEFSKSERTVSFAGQTFKLPASSSKFTIHLDQWPAGESTSDLTINNNVTVGAKIKRVSSTTAGNLTTHIIVTQTDLVVRVETFTVAELDDEVRSITVTPIYAVGDSYIVFAFTFPHFTSSLNYDPTVYLTTTATEPSSAASLSSFAAEALSFLF